MGAKGLRFGALGLLLAVWGGSSVAIAETDLPTISGPEQGVDGQSADYTVTGVTGATGLEWRIRSRDPARYNEGAENRLRRVTADVESAYNPVVVNWRYAGRYGFHLAHRINIGQEGQKSTQSIALEPEFFVNPGAVLEFRWLLGYLSQAERLKAEISADAGMTWTSVWERSGNLTETQVQTIRRNGGNPTTEPICQRFRRAEEELEANAKSCKVVLNPIELAPFLGQVIRVRFVLDFPAAANFFINRSSLSYGVYFDNIQPRGADLLSEGDAVAAVPVSNQVSFAPTEPGEYLLEARARFVDDSVSAWGTGQPVLVAPANPGTPTFSFRPRTDVAVSTTITSARVVPTGIPDGAVVSVAGGEYSINGRPFRNNAAFIKPGENVRVRLTSASELNASASAALTIGGATESFTVTTKSE